MTQRVRTAVAGLAALRGSRRDFSSSILADQLATYLRERMIEVALWEVATRGDRPASHACRGTFWSGPSASFNDTSRSTWSGSHPDRCGASPDRAPRCAAGRPPRSRRRHADDPPGSPPGRSRFRSSVRLSRGFTVRRRAPPRPRPRSLGRPSSRQERLAPRPIPGHRRCSSSSGSPAPSTSPSLHTSGPPSPTRSWLSL